MKCNKLDYIICAGYYVFFISSKGTNKHLLADFYWLWRSVSFGIHSVRHMDMSQYVFRREVLSVCHTAAEGSGRRQECSVPNESSLR